MDITPLADAPRIQVLPPTLADQIAAGEVVERPASVVKELVENSIDAEARHIDVEIEAGGRRMIRVVDDGGGMTAEETRLALRRHATSKISSHEDLWRLSTFGFRGEALPSIAAVARVTIRSKRPSMSAGFSLGHEAGIETSSGDVGMPTGTHVEVHDLFWNTPARLKFMKSEATEAANIAEAVLRLALAHPEIHFRLRANRRVALDLPTHRDMAERVRAALARRGASVLHEARGEEAGIAVRAFLAAPEEASATPRSTFLFVGKRFVRDRSLLHALGMGYGELLEKGRYPLAALFVEVPGQELDVNVHPQKLEVRFARPQEVYGAVRHVVGAAVARAPWLPSAPLRAYTLPPENLQASDTGLAESPAPRAKEGGWQEPLRPTERSRPRALTRTVEGLDIPKEELAPPSAPSRLSVVRSSGFFAGLEYIGQVHGTYLICEGQDELVIVDQHAAHERVTFERLRQAHGQREVVRQRLLFPIPIEIDEATIAAVRAGSVLETLAGLGFEVEDFGPKTLLVRAVPDLLKKVDPKPLLTDVLAGLAADEQTGGTEMAKVSFDRVFATMACHAALRAGDVVSREQALALLAQLDEVDLRSHCPHGRPVLLRMPVSEIEQRLGRT
jgi:DNA mismatch repair protein MutL